MASAPTASFKKIFFNIHRLSAIFKNFTMAQKLVQTKYRSARLNQFFIIRRIMLCHMTELPVEGLKAVATVID